MLAALKNLSPSARRSVSALAALATLIVFTLPFGAAPPWDKFLHALFFGTLAALAYYLTTRNSAYVASCLQIVVLGGLVELLQTAVPNRETSGLDMLANVTGVLLAAAFMLVVKPGKNQIGGER